VWGEGNDMATGFQRVLGHLRAEDGPADAHLLARFVAERDELAFAELVRRYGPMVLGVCRRVLGDAHDAEDAFQAAFLVLARKASTVARRESVGGWLYRVATRAAAEASAVRARRRARERQVNDMPEPESAPAGERDWRPVLDGELARLPAKYRAALALCDLGGMSRREAARQLGVPEGTLSSRLATARAMLAKRLADRGVTLPAGALSAVLAGGAASARVPAALVWTTAKAAAKAASGQLAASPAAELMTGVMKAMLVKQVKLGIGTVVAVAALGLFGFAYQGGGSGSAQAAPPGKPSSELEALRKENELLKLNLQIVLEKARVQEEQLSALKPQQALWGNRVEFLDERYEISDKIDKNAMRPDLRFIPHYSIYDVTHPDVSTTAGEVESALKALREARDKDGQKKAAEALETAMKKLREQVK
jgi:RNA polymerase sigma factor (sigma-70 family)